MDMIEGGGRGAAVADLLARMGPPECVYCGDDGDIEVEHGPDDREWCCYGCAQLLAHGLAGIEADVFAHGLAAR